MSYSQSDFEADAVTVARTLHVAYNRCRMLADRALGMPTPTDPKMQLILIVTNGLVADFDASGPYGIKRNMVLNLSDLKLPGD